MTTAAARGGGGGGGGGDDYRNAVQTIPNFNRKTSPDIPSNSVPINTINYL